MNAYAHLYERLPIQHSQIRLLHIKHATNSDEPIRCELAIADLNEEHVRYVGISYTWGTEARNHVIHCGNLELSVTMSCADALHAMRARGEANIWIDQVCINQVDMEERNSQVASMANIYANAAIVFVWLGRLSLSGELSRGSLDRDFPDMDTAIAALRAGQQRNTNEIKQKGGRSNIDYEMLSNKVLPTDDSEPDITEVKQITSELTAFLNLFERPYFERRWVIQEVTGHKDVRVLIDDIELDFDLLFDAALYTRSFYSAVLVPWWLDSLESRMGEQFVKRLDPVDLWMRSVNVDLMHRIRLSRRDGQDLVWHVLHGCTFFRTQDPRDSLYSLRAIWTALEPPQPDYSLDIDSVTVKHTQWLMEQGYASLILESAPLSRLTRSAIPSWCVDFSCAFDMMLDNTARQDLSYRQEKLYIYLSETATPGMREFVARPFYGDDGNQIPPSTLFPDAAKCMPHSFTLKDADRPELHTKVVILDTVSEMLSEDFALDEEKYPLAWEWYMSKKPMQADQVKQRIDSQQEWARKVDYGSLYENIVVFREKMFYHITGSSKQGEKRPPKIINDELRTQDNYRQDAGFLTFWDHGAEEPSYTMLGDIRFGITHDGWPVILPPDVEVGDKVVFVCGVKTPFILRAVDDSRYQIVGQTHVMSLMWWWNEIPEAIREQKVQTIVLV